MSRRKPLTPEQRALIVDALLVCSNAAAVVRSGLDVNPKQVQNVAREEGIALKDGHAAKGWYDRTPADVREKAIVLLKEKRNAAAVRRVFPDLSHTTLASIAREEDIPLTASRKLGGGPHLSRQQQDEITQALSLDTNATRVAAALGIGVRAVQRFAGRQNIELTAGKATKFKAKIPDATRQEIPVLPESDVSPIITVVQTVPTPEPRFTTVRYSLPKPRPAVKTHRESPKTNIGVANLVTALQMAELRGDREKIGLLVSSTPADMLREALAHIRALKSKLSDGPAS